MIAPYDNTANLIYNDNHISSVYICIYIYTHTYTYIHIYIYIYRERDVYMYIYIYIYIYDLGATSTPERPAEGTGVCKKKHSSGEEYARSTY